MKDLQLFEQERAKCVKTKYDNFFLGEVESYNYDDCVKLIDLKFDDTKKYECFADYQGGDFAVDRILTAKGWAEQALDWCDMDDHMEFLSALIDDCDEEKLINEIQSFWEIGIRPVA